VPASYNDYQRKFIIKAGRDSGIKFNPIINKNTASAISYAANGKEGNVLVFDLGGGNLDVSVINIFNENDVCSIDVLAAISTDNIPDLD
jgi:molecular chaperone DnaK (HSP70)